MGFSKSATVEARIGDSLTHSSSLTLVGKPTFSPGGQIVIRASPPRGITDLSGDYLAGGPLNLSGIDRVFTIRPKGL